MARTAVVSKEIYEQVESAMAEDNTLSRQEVFRQLAAQSDKSLGNISASYYREARNRKKGSDARPPKRSGPAPQQTAADVRARRGNLEQLAQQLAETSREIMQAVEVERKSLADERAKVEEAKRTIMRA